MKNKALSITIACAIGSTIGTMLALKFGAYWAFGVLLGSVAGYFIYDFNAVIKAIPIAYNYAKEKRKAQLNFILGIIAVGGVPVTYFIAIVLHLGIITSDSLQLALVILEIFIMSCAFFTNAAIIEVCYVNAELKDQAGYDFCKFLRIIGILKVSKMNWGIMIFMILFSFPIISIMAPILLLEYTFKATLLIPKGIKIAALFLCKFLWKFFKIIHSDLRLLVGIDSTIGAFAGFMYSNMLLGMFVGAVWGFLNYYIVSLKLLKLKPNH